MASSMNVALNFTTVESDQQKLCKVNNFASMKV